MIETIKNAWKIDDLRKKMLFTMMVIVLRYMKERVQIIASAGYTVFFLLVTIPLIRAFGIKGMAWGILSANVLKFVLYSILGLLSPGGENHEKK